MNLLIKDSANRFKTFKAEFKELTSDDSVFYSSFNLAGTTDNTISISNWTSTYVMDNYFAAIGESIPENRGRKLADEWKDKLFASLSNQFQLTEIKSKKYPSDYGWSFERGYFSIDIRYLSRRKGAASLLLLSIHYTHLRETRKD